MSKEELKKLKEKTVELYKVYVGYYAEQAGRGPRPGLDTGINRAYGAFNASNQKLPEEHRIVPTFTLKPTL